MITVVLAAGKSSRFKSAKHKGLHDLLGKSIVQRVSETLRSLKAQKTIYVLGHMLPEMKATLQPWEDYVEQKEQLGTAHALLQALESLTELNEKGILVTCVDTPLLTQQTLLNLLKTTKESNSQIGVLSSLVENPTGYGRILRKKGGAELLSIIEEKDANSEIKQIKEVNAGVYYFDLSISQLKEGLKSLKNTNKQNEYYLTDIVEWANGQGYKISVYQTHDSDEILGINNRADLAQAHHLLSQRSIKSLMETGVTFTQPNTCLIAPEALIEADTIVQGNSQILGVSKLGSHCVIGPNTNIVDSTIGNFCNIKNSFVQQAVIGDECSVGPFANLRPGSKLAKQAFVGDFVEIKNSTIGSNSKIPHLSYIGDAELGENINIGAGSITANYNAITQEKQKTIIQDDVKVGSNSVLVAPLNIAAGCMIGAGTVLSKNVDEPNSLVLARPETVIKKNWVTNKLLKSQ